MSSHESRFRLPGEYQHEGLLLCDAHPRHLVDKVKDADLSGDVLVATYPKTGTTWAQEMIWLLRNKADFETAKSVKLTERFPYLDFGGRSQGPYELGLCMDHPRTVKTHLPAQFLARALANSETKIVVVARNPKDTLVSLYHFYQMNEVLGMFKGSWDEFFALFADKHLYYGDFFDWYLSWWQYRHQPNVLFITYEEMHEDLKAVVKSVAKFLDESFTEEDYDKVVEHLQFKNMKTNKSTNYEMIPVMKQNISPFMRKGEVGDWKNFFSQEQSDFVDQRYKETLEKEGLILKFE